MSKFLKKTITSELEREIGGVRDMVLVDASKLKGLENWAFRGVLDKAGIRMKVVKNRLARVALKNGGITVPDDFMRGSCAVLYGGETAGAISRAIAEWNRSNPEIAVRGGLIEGAVGSAEAAKAWASLPTRGELLSQLLGAILAPAVQIATAFESALSLFPSLVAAHVEKSEKEGAGGETGTASQGPA